jgi:MFS family permease
MGLAVACGLMAGGEGIVFLCLALFGLRLCGQGLLGHTSQTAMARYFDAGRGKALSIASQGHAIAQALFPSLVVLMVGYVGWRSAWGWYGLILVLVMAPVVLILLRGHGDRHDALVTRLAAAEENSRSSDSGSSSAVRQWTLREVLRHPTFYLVMTNVVAPGMLMTGLMFHQIHILEVKNWDIAWFAFCFVAYSGFSVLTGIAVGPMIDRYSAKRLITSYLAPMGLGILALVVSDHPAAVLVWFVLSGATSGMHRSVVSAYWAEANGVRHLGAIRSLVSSVSVVGTAISPVLFGWMIDDGASVELIATICVVWIALAIPSTWFGLRYSVNT